MSPIGKMNITTGLIVGCLVAALAQSIRYAHLINTEFNKEDCQTLPEMNFKCQQLNAESKSANIKILVFGVGALIISAVPIITAKIVENDRKRMIQLRNEGIIK